MQSQILIALAIARDFQAREIQHAADHRRRAIDRPSIRRSFGRRLIAIGQRIAAEPSLELARSR